MEIQNRVHTASGFSVPLTRAEPSPDATQRMSERNGNSAKLGLLSIPPEIRDNIYGHLLPDIQEFHPHQYSYYLACLRWKHQYSPQRLNKQFCPPAIARVHPMIRAEVLARLYTNLRVCITETPQTTPFTKWLGKCNTDIISSIRSITIVAHIYHSSFRGDALIINLSSQPKAEINFPHEPASELVFSKHEDLLDAARTAVSRTMMEACMPRHPHYERRVFTQHAFMTLKAELWYALEFTNKREVVLDPEAKKAAERRLRRRRGY